MERLTLKSGKVRQVSTGNVRMFWAYDGAIQSLLFLTSGYFELCPDTMKKLVITESFPVYKKISMLIESRIGCLN